MEFLLKSSSFDNEELIPSKYTCDGDNISPQLSWEKAPEGSNTFALIMEDPDALGGLFVHWIFFNIPAEYNSLPEDVTVTKNVPVNSMQGTNHYGDIGYGGPCPPTGTHRYYFRLYALDTALRLDEKAGKKDLMKAMEGHILAEAVLMGKYRRK